MARRDRPCSLPTAIASGVLFALSGGLLWYVVAFDARLRHWSRRG